MGTGHNYRLRSFKSSIARINEAVKLTKEAYLQNKKKVFEEYGPAEHGRKIWAYHHLQKNNVVYSLTKNLNNNAALTQIPFNGKKTVPRALRKDLWHPFAVISFPPGYGAVGLSAFQKLREYRRRHELEWGDEIRYETEIVDGKEERKNRSRVARGRLLQDQKANSVADMAAVLGRLRDYSALAAEGKEGEVKATPAASETTPKPEETTSGPLMHPKYPKRVLPIPVTTISKSIGLQGEGSGINVQIYWKDIHDAEYAQTWDDNVEHGVLHAGTRYVSNKERKIKGVLEALEDAGEGYGLRSMKNGMWMKSTKTLAKSVVKGTYEGKDSVKRLGEGKGSGQGEKIQV